MMLHSHLDLVLSCFVQSKEDQLITCFNPMKMVYYKVIYMYQYVNIFCTYPDPYYYYNGLLVLYNILRYLICI